ncbi:MAG: CD225/dispanin family protein [Planctomycetota bacterium]
MAQTTECSSCGKSIKLPEDAAGKKIKCADCGAIHVIHATPGGTLFFTSASPPPGDSGDLDAHSAPQELRSRKGRRRKKSRSRSRQASPGSAKSTPHQSRERKPSNNLAIALISTLCCFFPLGFVSIYYAIKVDGHWRHGEDREAYAAANKAKNYAIWGMFCGLAIMAIWRVIKFNNR